MRSGRLLGVVVLLAAISCHAGAPATQPAAGKTDVTFFVAADAHFGMFKGIDELNRVAVQAMNSLPGKVYPVGAAKVAEPRGVLFAGDATDHGFLWEWKAFLKYYGLRKEGGLLNWPMYECPGNHDQPVPLLSPVLPAIRSRHKSLLYSWDWDGVHLACLGMYPDAAGCRWLADDLKKIDKRTPVVLYFHYALLGPFSGPEWWTDKEKDAFGKTIDGYNVVAIFHGHFHGSEHYQWRGRDIYNVGSPVYNARSFAVVHITDKVTIVASWNWDLRQWEWVHAKRQDKLDAKDGPH